jgi:hypothetical protein
VATLLSSTFGSAQTKLGQKQKAPAQSQDFFSVDRIPPPYCDVHLVFIPTIQGNDAYRRLRVITEALITAQDGAENLKHARESLKKSTDPADTFSELFEAEQRAIDGLHCAAQVMHSYKAIKENQQDDLLSVTLIAGFNREAYAVELLRTSQKERFSRSKNATPAQVISDAEKLQRITDLQRDGGSSILEASSLAGSISADMSDENATKIEYSQLSCPNSTEIVDLLTTVATNTETIYGQSAKMIIDLIAPLKCRQ